MLNMSGSRHCTKNVKTDIRSLSADRFLPIDFPLHWNLLEEHSVFR